jgi:hypothetical protein
MTRCWWHTHDPHGWRPLVMGEAGAMRSFGDVRTSISSSCNDRRKVAPGDQLSPSTRTACGQRITKVSRVADSPLRFSGISASRPDGQGVWWLSRQITTRTWSSACHSGITLPGRRNGYFAVADSSNSTRRLATPIGRYFRELAPSLITTSGHAFIQPTQAGRDARVVKVQSDCVNCSTGKV